MKRLILLPSLLAILAFATPVVAQNDSSRTSPINSNCPSFFLAGQAPIVVGPPARSDDRIICHSFYVISYSTTLRDPLWTSYRLTREMAEGGDSIGRFEGNFRRERGLTANEQGAHRDFVHPPFDRGHLTPANDAVDMSAQRDTFVITNVVPQVSEFNQGLWRFLEAAVHRLAKIEGEVFIVTGAVYSANPPIMSRPNANGRIAVPDLTFKAIYIPSRDIAIGYLATNEITTACTVMSVSELTRRTGVNPFPSLPSTVTAQLPAFTLPPAPQNDNTPLPDCRPANTNG